MDAPASRPERPPIDAAPPLELEQVLVDGMRVRLGPPAAARHGLAAAPSSSCPAGPSSSRSTARRWRRSQDWGFAAAILDWRGQGGSDRFLAHRHRGHVVQVEDYLADLDAVMARLEQLRLPRPFVMLSHSMGGHIGLRYLHAHPDRFAGSVMSAPMFGIRLTPTPEPVARALCAAAIRLGGGTRYAPGQRDFALERYVFARNRLTSSPGALRRAAPPRRRHARAGAGRGHLWLARAPRCARSR